MNFPLCVPIFLYFLFTNLCLPPACSSLDITWQYSRMEMYNTAFLIVNSIPAAYIYTWLCLHIPKHIFLSVCLNNLMRLCICDYYMCICVCHCFTSVAWCPECGCSASSASHLSISLLIIFQAALDMPVLFCIMEVLS